MELGSYEPSVLLDTHTLIWAITDRSRLSCRAAYFLDRADSVRVSAATAWEIATKVRRGRLDEASVLEKEFLHITLAAGYEFTSIEVEVALTAGRFSSTHKDPFDRILAAQALALKIPIVSIDPQLDAFGVRRIW